jgi:hypothetical protein
MSNTMVIRVENQNKGLRTFVTSLNLQCHTYASVIDNGEGVNDESRRYTATPSRMIHQIIKQSMDLQEPGHGAWHLAF